MSEKRRRFLAVMPTFNQAEFIDEAIEAVIDQLDILCIVDDASTDSTADKILALEESRGAFFHMRHGENKKTAIAINSGVEMLELYYPEDSECEDWITWVSSDNTYEPDWIEAFRRAQAGSEDVGLMYSGFKWSHNGRLQFTPYSPDRQIRTPNCYLGPSFFVRRDVWRECGGHRGAISHDLDHFLRLEETCWRMGLRLVAIETFPCLYRVHPNRATTKLKHTYDAPHWINEAKKRRRCR